MINIVKLTEAAEKKCSDLMSRESRDDLRLRISVQPGGCSGLKYSFFFDNRVEEEDIIEEFGDVEVIIDKMSAPYLEGSTVNYQDTIEMQGFEIDNPNAEGSCACGDSFH